MWVNFPMFGTSCYLALSEAYLIFIRKLGELVKMACLPISYFVILRPTVGTLWGGRAWLFKNKWMLSGGKLQELWFPANFAGFRGFTWNPRLREISEALGPRALSPPHGSCNFCGTSCACGDGSGCTQPIKYFDKQPTPSAMLPIKSRSVTDEERAILKHALS